MRLEPDSTLRWCGRILTSARVSAVIHPVQPSTMMPFLSNCGHRPMSDWSSDRMVCYEAVPWIPCFFAATLLQHSCDHPAHCFVTCSAAYFHTAVQSPLQTSPRSWARSAATSMRWTNSSGCLGETSLTSRVCQYLRLRSGRRLWFGMVMPPGQKGGAINGNYSNLLVLIIEAWVFSCR